MTYKPGQPQELLAFWFSEPMNQHWFRSTPEIDSQLRQRYESLWQQGQARQLERWKQAAESCLALVILLDQLPLNMFRGEARSFSTESMAIEATLHGLEQGFDQVLSGPQQAFFYMPLMHSEDLVHQDLSVACFEKAGLEDNLRFARHHRDLVLRFGRFPHRNSILGRDSTPEELEYLGSKQAFKG